ncbi:unnamed protein product [Clonostachys rhizophaga]|uniref:Uncharacterized protein n=1 Tax=Clonostachys rhizophaga TaxID=160324 RepID=A0A9N9V6S3_9HYPO|nr:unnamed protein product [Clonostachys rhizophaga]
MSAEMPDYLDSHGHKWASTCLIPSHLIHKPGHEQGNDASPEYHAQAFPPGTAPTQNTFRPNPINADIGQANNPDAMNEESHTGALDMPGSTSKDIYNSTDVLHGRPMIGQTSREIKGAHPGKRKKERSSLEGVGASNSDSVFRQVRQQVADKDNVEKGQRGYTGEQEGGTAAGGAESIPPVSAEERVVRQGPHGRAVKY